MPAGGWGRNVQPKQELTRKQKSFVTWDAEAFEEHERLAQEERLRSPNIWYIRICCQMIAEACLIATNPDSKLYVPGGNSGYLSEERSAHEKEAARAFLRSQDCRDIFDTMLECGARLRPYDWYMAELERAIAEGRRLYVNYAPQKRSHKKKPDKPPILFDGEPLGAWDESPPRPPRQNAPRRPPECPRIDDGPPPRGIHHA
jgi:hypothetical protein